MERIVPAPLGHVVDRREIHQTHNLVAIAVLGSNNEHPTTKDKPIPNARIKRTMCSSRQLQCRDSILSETHVHLLPLRVIFDRVGLD